MDQEKKLHNLQALVYGGSTLRLLGACYRSERLKEKYIRVRNSSDAFILPSRKHPGHHLVLGTTVGAGVHLKTQHESTLTQSQAVNSFRQLNCSIWQQASMLTTRTNRNALQKSPVKQLAYKKIKFKFNDTDF